MTKAARGFQVPVTQAKPATTWQVGHEEVQLELEANRTEPTQREGPTDPAKGKPRSLMQPQPLAEVHPFTPVMREWREGIAVDCGPD